MKGKIVRSVVTVLSASLLIGGVTPAGAAFYENANVSETVCAQGELYEKGGRLPVEPIEIGEIGRLKVVDSFSINILGFEKLEQVPENGSLTGEEIMSWPAGTELNSGYVVESVSWRIKGRRGYVVLSSSSEVKPGAELSVTCKVKLSSGYLMLNNATGTINGKEATVTKNNDGDIYVTLTGILVSLKATQSSETQDMHRLYNPNSGEHFYTASVEERDNLITLGWQYEGIAWKAPVYSSVPVYRLFNPNDPDHHYTMSEEEKDTLVTAGWVFEGIGWYSDENKGVTMHRLYNPNERTGNHHYTSSVDEKEMLVGAGWIYEGEAWYGVLTEAFRAVPFFD